jgi:hypothetical protein
MFSARPRWAHPRPALDAQLHTPMSCTTSLSSMFSVRINGDIPTNFPSIMLLNTLTATYTRWDMKKKSLKQPCRHTFKGRPVD